MKPTDIEDEDEPGFFKRNLVMLILGGLVLTGGGYMYLNHKPSKSKPQKKFDMVMVMPVIPPPPPPPPPKEEPPPEEKEEEMVEQAPEEIAEKPEEKPSDEPKDEPLGTAIAGGDGSGLAIGGGSGGRGMIGGSSGRKGGTKWGWYAGAVQNRISEALRSNKVTRRASAVITVRIWPDATGRITKVTLGSSTGDPAMDDAIKNQVLVGLVLNEPPPSDMPLPINLRITARQP